MQVCKPLMIHWENELQKLSKYLYGSREHIIFERNKKTFMRGSVTIKDLAKELGIHHVTVSRALRNCDSVKKETRELIKKKAKELGYKPNLLAQGFRNKRSNVLAILVPDLQHHFFSKFISDFAQKAYENGYSVMVFQSSEKLSSEKEIVNSLISYHVAGVIASVTKETTDGSHFDLLKDGGIPYVLFDRVPDKIKASQVLVNNFQGAYDAVTMMIGSGRKHIAYISAFNQLNVFRDRLAGYKQALIDNGLPFKEELVTDGGFFMEDGFAEAQILMNLEEKPDGILAVRDEVAIGVIKYLKKIGTRVPEDVAVIGFDNDPMGIACEPELTTVKQSIPNMVESTFDLLMNLIEDSTCDFKKKIINAEIVQRGSS